MQSNQYIEQLKERISELNPYLILLFGSYAYGTPRQDSDIDLLVVTNDDFMPQTFKERTEISLKIKKQIYEINQEVAIDLIVYTRPMFEKFISLNSLFSQEILTKGIKLYENRHTAMA